MPLLNIKRGGLHSNTPLLNYDKEITERLQRNCGEIMKFLSTILLPYEFQW